ncbi:Pre-mRNA-splicing helicase BRR2 [Talaromyces islandicus]|uniref:Pre-mRNA-splicing helicase BRR2 n=1 Tax=Talaromyces islandicus TaxID=28573 RepID=A0A0U1M2C8_TALIS|nr:Pre-mRNA-splicing helicase BRR2 [Talaromyces islandicus]
MKPYPNPGYQGSSSLKTVLDNLGDHLAVRIDTSQPHVNDEQSSRDAVLRADSSKMVYEGVQLLETFLDYLADDAFRRLFSEMKGGGLQTHLGTFLLFPFFESLAKEIDIIRQSQDRQASLFTLSQRLFEKANQCVEIHSGMTLEEFAAQYTGLNLRWETTSIASTGIRVPHPACKTEEERQSLRTNLVHLTNKCVGFCDSLDTLNDITMIFIYESFLLASIFYGDQSFKAWRRLNHASSALFADGLHETVKEKEYLPFFLTQLRQQIFARIYGSDISFAVFLGRPPRVSKRFCYTSMPLDVEEDTYSLVGEALCRELGHLDRNGWNTLGEIRKSAVVRWSMITSMIREDALETLLGRNLTNIPQRIGELQAKIDYAWKDLPPFLTIPTRDMWLKGRSCHEVDTLHQIRLLYLNSTFLIEWAASRHGLQDTGALFVKASELLAWVNEALVRREQLSEMGLISLAWRVASCALPAAGAIAWYLLQPSSRVGFDLDSSRRRSIENLSVLIAHMAVLHDPGDGNYQLFCHAKSALQSAMDTILSPPDPGQPENSLDMLSTAALSPDWIFSDYLGLGVDSWIGLPDRGSFMRMDDNMPY